VINNAVNYPEIHALLGINAADVTTLVDVGIEIEGVVRNHSERAILISGRVIGSIESAGPVIINQGAEVVGSITALSMQLGGKVSRRNKDDCLNIKGALVVAKTAHMGCDAECDGVQLEYGATIDGSIRPRPAVAEHSNIANALKSIHALRDPFSASPLASVGPLEDIELAESGA